MRHSIHVIINIIICVFLVSCGGGGGSSKPVNAIATAPSDPILTGYFTDNGVEGLSYTTETQSGVTDAAGEFKYKEGEKILFSIGIFEIGETVTATAKMTPVNLISGAMLPTSSSELKKILDKFWEYRPGDIYQSPSSFLTLHNMITFLHALDGDKDEGNGISIRDGMDVLLDGLDIDFTANPYSFRDNIVVRTLLREAVTQNLISSAFVKYPGQAMDDFYSEHGVDHGLTSIATETKDSEHPNVIGSIISYTFDENSNKQDVITDYYADGTVDEIKTYTYDSVGNEVGQNVLGSDGTSKGSTSNIFDGAGRRISQREEGGSNLRLFSYIYDDNNGNLLSYSIDSNADGIAEVVGEATYDMDGNWLTRNDDVFGNGSTITATYDGEGNM